MDRERHTDRHTDIEIQRETETHIDRERERQRQTDRQTETETDRETDGKQTVRQTKTEADRFHLSIVVHLHLSSNAHPSFFLHVLYYFRPSEVNTQILPLIVCLSVVCLSV